MRLLQKAVLRLSEIIFGAELKLSLGEHGGGNDSGCTRAIVNIVVRQGEGGVVEGVKGFCANLQVSALAEIEDLAKRQIGGHFSGPNQAICGLVRTREVPGGSQHGPGCDNGAGRAVLGQRARFGFRHR